MFKVNEGRPNIVDLIKTGKIDLVINTPLGRESFYDEKSIRRAAIRYNIPCITTLAAAHAHDAAAYVQTIASGEVPVEQLENILGEQALDEELFLGLRQLEGIDLARLERTYHTSLEARFARLHAAGLVERAGPVVRLVPERLSISNEAFVELMR